MAYTHHVSTVKVGDIFTDELIAKINEILLDIKNDIEGRNETIQSENLIVIGDNVSSNVNTFTFYINKQNTPNLSNILKYYKSYQEYNNGEGPSLLEVSVGDDFQINADTQIDVWNKFYNLNIK